jgi:hypothetical protein
LDFSFVFVWIMIEEVFPSYGKVRSMAAVMSSHSLHVSGVVLLGEWQLLYAHGRDVITVTYRMQRKQTKQINKCARKIVLRSEKTTNS